MAESRLRRSGSPRGLTRAVFRAPIPLYRARLGFLFGKRFLMLEHIGRKSAQTRRTVLEVVLNDADAVFVASGWGECSQWLQNVMANPSVVVHLGSSRWPAMAARVTIDRAREVMEHYAAAHPKALRRLASFMLDDPGNTDEERVDRVAETIPIVRLAKPDDA